MIKLFSRLVMSASYRQGGCSHGCLPQARRSVETSNVPAICTNDAGVQVELEATHAKMNYWVMMAAWNRSDFTAETGFIL